MTQAYSDPSRESSPTALPDVEIFYLSQKDFICAEKGSVLQDMLKNEMEGGFGNLQAAALLAGWYWWFCFPGCLPESNPFGPFETEEAALKAARDQGD